MNPFSTHPNSHQSFWTLSLRKNVLNSMFTSFSRAGSILLFLWKTYVLSSLLYGLSTRLSRFSAPHSDYTSHLHGRHAFKVARFFLSKSIRDGVFSTASWPVFLKVGSRDPQGSVKHNQGSVMPFFILLQWQKSQATLSQLLYLGTKHQSQLRPTVFYWRKKKERNIVHDIIPYWGGQLNLFYS